LVIYGEGQQIRDYVYVDDVVRALAAAATAPNVASQIINIGTGVGTSINDLVRAIERVTSRQATTVVNPSVSGGVSSLVADTGRARRLLDYQPRVALAEGLARLIEEEPNLRP
jgi:nucleoside-diphosphate-sugar epimerase